MTQRQLTAFARVVRGMDVVQAVPGGRRRQTPKTVSGCRQRDP
jgi:hypothetical protein